MWTELPKRLYERAMASSFAPLDQPSWDSLTWQEKRWWNDIVALKART